MGRISRENAMEWVVRHDGQFPEHYAGVKITEVLDRVGVDRDHLNSILDQYTNWDLFNTGGPEVGLIPEKF
jgi:hypothetical protein